MRKNGITIVSCPILWRAPFISPHVPLHRVGMPSHLQHRGGGSHSPPQPRALGGDSKAPSSLGPTEGKQPESAATRPRSTCCPLSCSRWPPSRWVPCPLQPACQEADGWAHVHCSCGARQHCAWLQGQWSVPGDNQRRQAWPVTVGLRPPLSAVRPGQPFI